jgi:hypothetical protein
MRPPQRSPLRITLAVVILVGLIVLTLMYHDGAIAVDRVAEANEADGQYRLKGEVVSADEEGFVLEDPTDSVRVVWNVTKPQVGESYVVVGVYNATAGALEGEAVVRTYVF